MIRGVVGFMVIRDGDSGVAVWSSISTNIVPGTVRIQDGCP